MIATTVDPFVLAFEIACIVVAIASVVIAVRVNRIAKLLEESERRENEARRIRNP